MRVNNAQIDAIRRKGIYCYILLPTNYMKYKDILQKYASRII